MKNKIAIAFIGLILGTCGVFAQAPNWSVNPNQYQYSMTVTGVIELNCTELMNSMNQVGAFVGTTVRGSGMTSTVFNGQNLVSLTVYSDTVGGETITFQFYDQAGNMTYQVVDSISFQDNGLVGTSSNPFVFGNNHAPDSLFISSDSLTEGMPSGTVVGTLSSLDQSLGQTHTYSLVVGQGDADNASFSISGANLVANFSGNFAQKSSYQVRLRTTDSDGCSLDSTYTIFIGDVNLAPNSIALNPSSIAENLNSGSYVGLLTAQDDDVNDSFIYSLVNGAGGIDNNSFTISNDSLFSAATFDFETKLEYSIRIQVNDAAANAFTDTFKVQITDANDAPIAIGISNDSIDENAPTNTLIGNLSTTDIDAGQTSFTYSFDNIPGNSNSDFNLVGNELRSAIAFDFENAARTWAYIKTNDGNGGEFSDTIFVNIRDKNDAPTDILLSTQSANESQPIGTFIAKINTIDPDVSTQSFSYSLAIGAGDTNNTDFSVRNDSLFSAIVFDKNTKVSHGLRIEVMDQDLESYSKSFVIFVKDINNPPTAISLSNNTVDENLSVNRLVGLFNSTDNDLGDIHSYSLVNGTGGNDNSAFQIAGNQLLSNTMFDFNTKDEYSIRIETNDGFGGTFQDTFKINITDVNDTPTDITITNNTVQENSASGTSVGIFNTIDRDTADTYTYALTNTVNNDNQSFIVVGNELRTIDVFDFESRNLFTVEVRTTDDRGESFTKSIVISILDSNDAPSVVTISADSVVEKSPKGTYVANLITIDDDAVDNFTYSLVNGFGAEDNNLFKINGNLLELDSAIELNDKATRRVRIQSSDKGGLTTESSFIIRVLDANDAPTDLIVSNLTLQENNVIGATVGQLSAIDEDANDTFTFTLVNGAGDKDNDEFNIQGNSIVAASTFDFENKSSYDIRLQVLDAGGLFFEKQFTVLISNENEKPSLENQTFSLVENSPINTVVGMLTANDVDANETLTYQFLENQNLFALSTSGELKVVGNLDFESNSEIDLQVVVQDMEGLRDSAIVSISINDEIEGSLPAAGYFSPNGDGMNDTWSIRNVELYSDFSLKIFSANGQLVYEKASNYNNDWDGNNALEGVYYYLLEDNQNSSRKFKGLISLKR